MKSKFITLFAALAVLSLTACGTLSKSSQTTKAKEETKKETVSTTKTTVEETIDTTIKTPSETFSVEAPLEPILGGDTAEFDTEEGKVILVYDKATKRLKTTVVTKPKPVVVQLNRKTTTEAAVKTTETAKKETKDTAKTVTKKPSLWSWWWLLIIPLLYIVYRLIPFFRALITFKKLI